MRYSILTLLICLLGFSLMAQNPPTPYAVQLAAFNEPVSLDYFEGFEDEEIYFLSVYGGTMFKYFTKNYTDKSKAMALVEKAKKAGHANAILVDMNAYRAAAANCCKAPDNAISITNIFYDFDKSALRPASKTVLNTAVSILKENPGYTIEVRAHTDAKGNDDYNLALSGRRRDAAVNYLKAKGISSAKITTSIHGENSPVAINETSAGTDSPEGRQFNRRVELIIRDPQGTVKAADLDFVPRELKQ